MPGSVQLASPTTVLPQTLCSAFTHSRQYLARENQYANGESQVRMLTATSRKSWQVVKRLAPADLAALRSFFLARKGRLEPFYFYDPYATLPVGSNYDATGVDPLGRYTVRFDCDWQQVFSLPRGEVSISLIEVA